MQTIFAAATPAGRTALTVLRISGPESLQILHKLTQKKGNNIEPRRAKLANLYTSQSQILDTALTLYFKRPHSYTGEDIVELHLHGGTAVSKAVQTAIAKTQLARHAEPGEFTKRAFQNSRMGLTQVEGIRDLLLAETETQRRAAVLGSSGKLDVLFLKIRNELINASAYLMAEIDFSEDNGLNFESQEAVQNIVRSVQKQLTEISETAIKCSEIVKSGVRVALLGQPNAGKSSLVNYLTQRSVSLVSNLPGTTRDVLEVSLDLNGNKAVLYDLAGIHETSNEVEKLGIDRAKEVVANADIVVYLQDPTAQFCDDDLVTNSFKSGELIRLSSKSDIKKGKYHSISTKTGEGVQEFINQLTQLVGSRVTGSSEYGLGLSMRAQTLISQEALPGLTRCLELCTNDIVLAQAELERAISAIGKICGQNVSTSEILDVLFSEFCIGK